MIRWCSYCQRYQGESEPLEDYAMSHGICPDCRRRVKDRSLDARFLERVRALGERMMAVLFSRETAGVEDILTDGRGIGMRPVDLVIGILQPSLYRVGNLWASGEITVEDEHRFTAFAHDLVQRVSAAVPAALLDAERPCVLLARPEGNAHALGLEIVALHLTSEEIPSKRLPGAADRERLLASVREHRPQVLGLSVSMIDQLQEIAAIKALLDQDPGAATPKLVVGGFPLRNGYRPRLNASVETFRESRDFVQRCRELCAPAPRG